MELDENNMLVEPEQYYKVEEELVSVKDNMWGLDRIRSSDGHTFRVEHDVTKKCVNILFDEEVEVPINHEADRRVTKAVKRARQRSLMEEELNEFKMSQRMQHTMFQSTETSIIEVKKDGASKQDTIMVGEEEPVTKKVAKRTCQSSAKRTTSATPTPEAPAQTGDHSDKCNSDKDEDHAAKAALAKPAPAAAAGEDSIDGENTRPTAKEATAKLSEKGSNEDSVDTNDEKAAKTAAIAAEEMDSPYNGNSESDDASTTETAHAMPMNDDKPPMAVKSDENEKSTAETDPTKPAPKAAAKKEEPSPHEETIDEEEKLTAKVADKNVENSSEDNSDEDVAVGEDSKHIKPSPEKHAAKPAAEAATTEENTDRDSPNSDEDPQDYQPPAKYVSTAASVVSKVLAPETKHKPKESEQNRNKGSQEGQLETKDTTTEDDAEEEYLNKLGMGWGADVLTDSGVNDDTLRDSTL